MSSRLLHILVRSLGCVPSRVSRRSIALAKYCAENADAFIATAKKLYPRRRNKKERHDTVHAGAAGGDSVNHHATDTAGTSTIFGDHDSHQDHHANHIVRLSNGSVVTLTNEHYAFAASLLERCGPFAALRYRACPRVLDDDQFWGCYFYLLAVERSVRHEVFLRNEEAIAAAEAIAEARRARSQDEGTLKMQLSAANCSTPARGGLAAFGEANVYGGLDARLNNSAVCGVGPSPIALPTDEERRLLASPIDAYASGQAPLPCPLHNLSSSEGNVNNVGIIDFEGNTSINYCCADHQDQEGRRERERRTSAPDWGQSIAVLLTPTRGMDFSSPEPQRKPNDDRNNDVTGHEGVTTTISDLEEKNEESHRQQDGHRNTGSSSGRRESTLDELMMREELNQTVVESAGNEVAPLTHEKNTNENKNNTNDDHGEHDAKASTASSSTLGYTGWFAAAANLYKTAESRLVEVTNFIDDILLAEEDPNTATNDTNTATANVNAIGVEEEAEEEEVCSHVHRDAEERRRAEKMRRTHVAIRNSFSPLRQGRRGGKGEGSARANNFKSGLDPYVIPTSESSEGTSSSGEEEVEINENADPFRRHSARRLAEARLAEEKATLRAQTDKEGGRKTNATITSSSVTSSAGDAEFIECEIAKIRERRRARREARYSTFVGFSLVPMEGGIQSAGGGALTSSSPSSPMGQSADDKTYSPTSATITSTTAADQSKAATPTTASCEAPTDEPQETNTNLGDEGDSSAAQKEEKNSVVVEPVSAASPFPSTSAAEAVIFANSPLFDELMRHSVSWTGASSRTADECKNNDVNAHTYTSSRPAAATAVAGVPRLVPTISTMPSESEVNEAFADYF